MTHTCSSNNNHILIISIVILIILFLIWYNSYDILYEKFTPFDKADDWSGYYNMYSDYWPNNYLSYGHNPYKNYFFQNV